MTSSKGFADLPLCTLEMRWTDRPAGENESPRRFLDFVVDGRSLFEELGGNRITLFGWLTPDVYEDAVNQLLLVTPTELAENRRELYVCSACADLGCGSITATLTRQDDRFVWADFAHYVNYSYNEGEDQMIERRGYERVGPFAFDATTYASTLKTALQTLKEQPGE